jgi:hypothetical protein
MLTWSAIYGATVQDVSFLGTLLLSAIMVGICYIFTLTE